MTRSPFVLLALSLLAFGAQAAAQQLGPDFAGSYVIRDLSSPPQVPGPLGGLTIDPLVPNVLLIGGSANTGSGTIYRVALERNSAGLIVGWGCGETAPQATAPMIDGGLAFAPNGVLLFTGWPVNTLGQILPGGSAPAKTFNLSTVGVVSSVGGMVLVPAGMPGAGSIKFLSYDGGRWHSASLVPDGAGTYDVASVSPGIQIGGGPEGATYIRAGNPGFPVDSVLVSEYGFGTIAAYAVDSNGDPIPGTRRVFVSGLSGAEGAFTDPVTGDLLFCTFSGNRVIAVSGFTTSDSCVGDVNSSGAVDGADLGLLLANWGDCPQCAADLNGDCVVNGLDLGTLLAAWGACQG
jgi:hypothetical protein